MVTLSANNLQQLAPGIRFAGSDCTTVCETNDVIHVVVAPEKDSMYTLYAVLSDDAIAKKYKITVDNVGETTISYK